MNNKNLPIEFQIENIREYLVTLWNGDTHEITAKMAGNIAMARDKNDEFADGEKGFYFKKSAVSNVKKIRDAKKEIARYVEKQEKLKDEKIAEEKARKQQIAILKFEKENAELAKEAKKDAKNYINKFSKIPSTALEAYYRVFLRKAYKKVNNIQ